MLSSLRPSLLESGTVLLSSTRVSRSTLLQLFETKLIFLLSQPSKQIFLLDQTTKTRTSFAVSSCNLACSRPPLEEEWVVSFRMDR